MRTLPVGRVYFAQAGPHVKIGFSADPEKRLDGMQTGNAHEFVLLGSIRGTLAAKPGQPRAPWDLRPEPPSAP